MKKMRTLMLLMAGGMLLSGEASAVTQTVTKQYSYQASEADSTQSARWTAMEQTRRLLLGELDAYLEGIPEVAQLNLAQDEIIALTAGVTTMEVVTEGWRGEAYRVEARISVDVGGVVVALDQLRLNGALQSELLRESRLIDTALKEKELLNRQLEADYYDVEKFDEYPAEIARITRRQKKGEEMLALAKEEARKPGHERQSLNYRDKAIDLLGEAMVLTELPEFRVYIPGRKYAFSLREGEQTDHWITFAAVEPEFKLSQAKGSSFVRVYDEGADAGAGKGAGRKNRLKLKAIKNSYIVLEVKGSKAVSP